MFSPFVRMCVFLRWWLCDRCMWLLGQETADGAAAVEQVPDGCGDASFLCALVPFCIKHSTSGPLPGQRRHSCRPPLTFSDKSRGRDPRCEYTNATPSPQDTLSLKIRTSTAEQYSSSPKNPALQLLQKSSKSASTTPSQQWRKTVRPRRDRFGTIPQKLEFTIFGKTVLMEVLW